jgi:flagellar protein FlaG
MARSTPLPPAAGAAAAGRAAGAPASGKAPAMPQKAEIQFDPAQQRRQLEEAIEQLNQHMKDNGRALAFSVDKQLDRTIVTVKNRETGDVVRQIPDEALLRVAHHIEDIKGLLQDERI